LKEPIHHINDDLLVKYLLQEATAEERRQVDAWTAADAGNQRYFDHFKLIWDTSRELAVTSTVNEQEAWQRFQQRVNGAPASQGIVRSFNRRFSTWRVAAMLAGTAVILAMVWFFAGSRGVTLAANETGQANTLPDGSVVTLNSHSKLSYSGKFNEDTRTVEMEGEAFFNITPNKNKPFVIHVNGITVKVVGTSFNIRTHGDKTEVIVETGIVEVSNDKQTIKLSPKEKIVLGEPDTALNKEPVTDQLYQYYRSKEFVCDNTPLWKLVQALNEAYHTNIVIEGNDIRNYPLDGVYHGAPEKILEVISTTLGIEVISEKDRIILK
jgi:transmembrane sensor